MCAFSIGSIGVGIGIGISIGIGIGMVVSVEHYSQYIGLSLRLSVCLSVCQFQLALSSKMTESTHSASTTTFVVLVNSVNDKVT